MRTAVTFIALFVLAVVALADPSDDWDKHKKDLPSEIYNPKKESEYKKRYLDAVKRANEYNSQYAQNKAPHKLKPNRWSHLSPKEFGHFRTGRRASTEPGAKYKRTGMKGPVPAKVDYHSDGLMTPAKDQGTCGCCYSFAVAAVLEGHRNKRREGNESLSNQQIIDCTTKQHYCDGCDGGVEIGVYRYIQEAGGIQSYDKYKYAGKKNTCKFDKKDVRLTIKGYKHYSNLKVDELKELLAKVGPLNVGIHALEDDPNLIDYAGGGVYAPKNCPSRGDELNHAVVLVGYGVLRGEPYWKIKNSWGPTWGEDGYLLLSQKYDCGVTTDVSHPVF